MIFLDLANSGTSHSNPDLYDIDIMDINVIYIVGSVTTKSWYLKEKVFLEVSPYLQQTLQRQHNFINDLHKILWSQQRLISLWYISFAPNEKSDVLLQRL